MASEPDETEEMGSEEEQMGTAQAEMPERMSEEPEAESQESSTEATVSSTRGEGRRTQLRRVSDSLQILSIEVGRFRKNHEANAKKLEAQVASLRKEFASHIRSKDSGAHSKSHVDTKRLEKQIASLRGDVASLKTALAKEAAKSRSREEAALSRIIARVKASRPAKSRPRASKKKR